MPNRKVSVSVYMSPEQDSGLRDLHRRTQVPVAAYIREGINLVLEKYANIIGDMMGQEILANDDDSEIMQCWVKFRQDLRQLLFEFGVRSNPGWTEDDIVDAFRQLLNKKAADA